MLNCSEASLGYRPLFTGGLCDFFFCFVQFLQADHLILGILQSQIIFFKILIGVQYYIWLLIVEIRISPATTRSSAAKPSAKLSE